MHAGWIRNASRQESSQHQREGRRKRVLGGRGRQTTGESVALLVLVLTQYLSRRTREGPCPIRAKGAECGVDRDKVADVGDTDARHEGGREEEEEPD